MRISESEKKRIKSMYGLINEDVPPSESVLVANKNPFKYPEYESARKPYNSSLKDGDLFYTTVEGEYEDYIESLFVPLYKSFVGRTIRISKTDEITTINVPVGSTDISLNYSYDKKIGITKGFVSFVYKLQNFPSYYSVNFSNIKDEYILIVEEGYTNPFTKKEITKDRVVEQSNNPEIYKTFNIIGNSIKSEFNKIFNNPSSLKDEVFQIKKIQRQKTDF